MTAATAAPALAPAVAFDWPFAWSILPQLLEALVVTVRATLVGFALALGVGLVLALARRSRLRPLALAALAFVEFVRSTPLLVQLFFLFYLVPAYGNVSPFVIGVAALGLHFGAYISEVYRAGVESVPAGQWEAATALNLSRRRTLVAVVLPQAIPPILPALGNYLIVMFKDVAVLSAITVVEVLQTAKIIGAESFRYLEPLTIVGLLYLALSYPSSLLVRALERRLDTT